jgi:uncharacterized protein DUF4129
VASSGGPAIGRLRGQELARRELARSIYRPSLLVRIWHDITHWLGSLLSTGAAGAPSWWGLVLLAIAVAAAVAAIAYWLGPTKANKRASDRAVAGSAPRSAREHRDAADLLAASGNYGGAIIERIRAIVVDLEARDILLRRPARTAMELATEARGAFPAEAAELTYAARSFDDVRYGGRTGSESAYRRVRDLDIRLAAATAAAADEAQSAYAGLPLVPFTVSPADQPPGPRR